MALILPEVLWHIIHPSAAQVHLLKVVHALPKVLRQLAYVGAAKVHFVNVSAVLEGA